MARIIVAFAEQAQCERIAGALEGSGFPVLRRCHSGAEVMRTLSACPDAIVVCGAMLRDRTADMLASDAGGEALMLVAGKPERLAMCENPNLFRLPWPFGRAELASAVRMLAQLHDMRKPRRGGEERELIERAKLRLMEDGGLSEEQAHRALQRASMRSGIKMSEGARRILNGDGLQ